MKKLSLTFTLIAILFATSSFDHYKPDESLLVGSWEVENFVKGTESIDVSPFKINLKCSVEGDLGQLSGTLRKDFFSGIYEVKSKKSIKLSNLIRTNYDKNETAKVFMDSFQQVSQYQLVDNELKLINQEKSIYITLKKK